MGGDSSDSGPDYNPTAAHSDTEELSSDSDALSDDSSSSASWIVNDTSPQGGGSRKRCKYIDDGAAEDNSLNAVEGTRAPPLPGHREPHTSHGDSARELWEAVLAWSALFNVSPEQFAEAAEDRCVRPVNASERREAAAFEAIHAIYEVRHARVVVGRARSGATS